MTDILPKRKSIFHKILSAFIAFTFALNLVLPPAYAQLIPQTLLNLPAPGTMVSLSAGYAPLLIKGIAIHPENPLQFDFIIDPGESGLSGEQLRSESTRLVKYFLASLTVPEDELWVNLSPYEKDRIVSNTLGQTEMGRDMLAQDYVLKQLMASLMYPEKELGKKFWDGVYKKAQEKFGTTQIPMDTFNKVWIVPQKAVVYEHGNNALVVESRLKVMLEQDYQAMGHNVTKSQGHNGDLVTGDIVPTQIIREVIIPALEKEVNEGQTFANLRQIYHSMILAAWYKRNLKESILSRVYVNRAKIKGVDVEDKEISKKIYGQYLEAFKKGVYNYIKEDVDPATKNVIPRKYFSGGEQFGKELFGSQSVLKEWEVSSSVFGKQAEETAKGSFVGRITLIEVDSKGKNEDHILAEEQRILDAYEKQLTEAAEPVSSPVEFEGAKYIGENELSIISADDIKEWEEPAKIDNSLVEQARYSVPELSGEISIIKNNANGTLIAVATKRTTYDLGEYQMGKVSVAPRVFVYSVSQGRMAAAISYKDDNYTEIRDLKFGSTADGIPMLAIYQSDGPGTIIKIFDLREFTASSPIDYEYWIKKLSLGESDLVHMKGLMGKFNTKQDPLVIAKTFLPAALLTDQERKELLGAIEYERLAQDVSNKQAAQNVVITLNPMDGGLGTSVKRESYLEKVMGRPKEDPKTGRAKLSAKATDLFFDISEIDLAGQNLVLAKPVKVSIAEIKLLRVINDVSQFGSVFFQPLVNTDSAPSYIKLLDSQYLPDRVSEAIPEAAKRTYRQVMAEKGVHLVAGKDAMLYQKDLPVINLETNELTDKYTAPGGHGQWGVRLLIDALNFRLPGDGKTHIRAFYNGDGIANFPDASIIGWMAKENVPIVMISTTKTGADKKGGQLGIQIIDADTRKPQILELAQAKEVKQADLFYAMGLSGLEKVPGDNAKEYTNEANKQYFNTNTAILNYNVLTPILNDLAGLDQVEFNGEIFTGRNVVERIISPDLIENEKEKADGKEYTQLEGAMGSSLLNLNAFFATTKDPRIKAIMDKHGVQKILRIVDVSIPNRTKLFTPAKNAFDFWLQAYSDYYVLDTAQWTLRDARDGLTPPAVNFTGPKRNGNGEIVYDRKGKAKPEDFYDDVQNVIDAFGTASTKELNSLTINGKVLLSNAILKGNVEIHSQYPFTFDLNQAAARKALGQEGKQPLVLYNIKVMVTEDGLVSSEWITASSPVSNDNEDMYSSREEEITPSSVTDFAVLKMPISELKTELQKLNNIINKVKTIDQEQSNEKADKYLREEFIPSIIRFNEVAQGISHRNPGPELNELLPYLKEGALDVGRMDSALAAIVHILGENAAPALKDIKSSLEQAYKNKPQYERENVLNRIDKALELAVLSNNKASSSPVVFDIIRSFNSEASLETPVRNLTGLISAFEEGIVTPLEKQLGITIEQEVVEKLYREGTVGELISQVDNQLWENYTTRPTFYLVTNLSDLNPIGREVVVRRIMPKYETDQDKALAIFNSLIAKIGPLPAEKSEAIKRKLNHMERQLVQDVQTEMKFSSLQDTLEYLAYAGLSPEETKLADGSLDGAVLQNGNLAKALRTVEADRKAKASSPVTAERLFIEIDSEKIKNLIVQRPGELEEKVRSLSKDNKLEFIDSQVKADNAALGYRGVWAPLSNVITGPYTMFAGDQEHGGAGFSARFGKYAWGAIEVTNKDGKMGITMSLAARTQEERESIKNVFRQVFLPDQAAALVGAAASSPVTSYEELNQVGKSVINRLMHNGYAENRDEALKILNDLAAKIGLAPRESPFDIYKKLNGVETRLVLDIQYKSRSLSQTLEYLAFAALNPEETKIADAFLNYEDNEHYFTKALEAVQQDRQAKTSSLATVKTEEELKTAILDIAVEGIFYESIKADTTEKLKRRLEQEFDQLKQKGYLELTVPVRSREVITNITITLARERKILFVTRKRVIVGTLGTQTSTGHVEIQLEGKILKTLASSPVGMVMLKNGHEVSKNLVSLVMFFLKDFEKYPYILREIYAISLPGSSRSDLSQDAMNLLRRRGGNGGYKFLFNRAWGVDYTVRKVVLAALKPGVDGGFIIEDPIAYEISSSDSASSPVNIGDIVSYETLNSMVSDIEKKLEQLRRNNENTRETEVFLARIKARQQKGWGYLEVIGLGLTASLSSKTIAQLSDDISINIRNLETRLRLLGDERVEVERRIAELRGLRAALLIPKTVNTPEQLREEIADIGGRDTNILPENIRNKHKETLKRLFERQTELKQGQKLDIVARSIYEGNSIITTLKISLGGNRLFVERITDIVVAGIVTRSKSDSSEFKLAGKVLETLSSSPVAGEEPQISDPVLFKAVVAQTVAQNHNLYLDDFLKIPFSPEGSILKIFNNPGSPGLARLFAAQIIFQRWNDFYKGLSSNPYKLVRDTFDNLESPSVNRLVAAQIIIQKWNDFGSFKDNPYHLTLETFEDTESPLLERLIAAGTIMRHPNNFSLKSFKDSKVLVGDVFKEETGIPLYRLLAAQAILHRWNDFKDTFAASAYNYVLNASSPVTNRGQGTEDKVQLTNDEERTTKNDVGGIDLNPALLDLQIKRDGNGVPLPLPQQPMGDLMRIEGFIPVIINMVPATNLPLLLGLADESAEPETDRANPALKARELEELSVLN